ncbi:hypothetical protein B0H15DRAFT_853370, partial [Mycena belliarum]
MTGNRPQPDSDDVGTNKPGFPASWLVASDQDVIDEAEWFNDATVISDPLYSVEWRRFQGRTSLRPAKNKQWVGPPRAMAPIRRRGITGPVVPICYIRATHWTYMLLFTTAGPAEDGKKTFYHINYVQDDDTYEAAAGTEVFRVKPPLDCVASYFNWQKGWEWEELKELEGLDQANKNAA